VVQPCVTAARSLAYAHSRQLVVDGPTRRGSGGAGSRLNLDIGDELGENARTLVRTERRQSNAPAR
jgi:hypothetical protein